METVMQIFLSVILYGAAIFAIFVVGFMYGSSNCTSFVGWIKEERGFWKDYVAEEKAKRAYLKSRPLCENCQKEGRFRKADAVVTYDGGPVSLCRNCYLEERNAEHKV